MNFGAFSSTDLALSGQDPLLGSLWDAAALGSSGILAGLLSAIRSTSSGGTEVLPESSGLELLPAVAAKLESNAPSEGTPSRGAATSDWNDLSWFIQSEGQRLNDSDPAVDSLTGVVESAALVNDSAKINFQPAGASIPSGYTADTGAAYDTNRGFGWVRQDSLSSTNHVPLNITPNARDRNRTGIDQRLDTLLHMQYRPAISSTTAVKTPAAWEYALPNGQYSVTVSVGDQPIYDSQHMINVEGVNAINRFQGSSTQEYKQATVQAAVNDGKLTIDALGGTNTKINYVDIASVPTSSGFTQINWSTAASSPIKRSETPGAVANGKLYAFGGYIDSTYNPTRRADVYNPATNNWTRIADLPNPLTHAGVAVGGKDIYLAGGYVGKSTGGQIFATKDVWKYNVDTNTCTALTPLPQPRGSGALELLGRQLHFFGGANINRVDKGDHWVLNLDGGTSWTSAASLPNSRSHLGDATLGGKIYAIGGQRGVDSKLITQNSVQVWDPATPNLWTAVASLPKSRAHIGAATFVMGDRIVVAGGKVAHSRAVSDVTAYNPLSNSWTALTSLPATRHSGVAGTIANQIFYTMGSPGFQTATYKGVPVI